MPDDLEGSGKWPTNDRELAENLNGIEKNF
jgi:hypothetical protein